MRGGSVIRENLKPARFEQRQLSFARKGAWTLCINVTPTSITSQLADARLVAIGDWRHEVIKPETPKALLSALAAHWREYRRQFPEVTINLALGVHGR